MTEEDETTQIEIQPQPFSVFFFRPPPVFCETDAAWPSIGRFCFPSLPFTHSNANQTSPLACCQIKAKVKFPSVQTPSEPFAPALRQCHCTLQDSVLVSIKQSRMLKKIEEPPSLAASSSHLPGQRWVSWQAAMIRRSDTMVCFDHERKTPQCREMMQTGQCPSCVRPGNVSSLCSPLGRTPAV